MFQLRLAFRALSRAPFVTGVAVLSLALGIGANAAIYSLFDQILLRPLPVTEPDRLVNLSAPGPKPGSDSSNSAGGHEDIFSYPMYRDLEREQTAFTSLAAHRAFDANLAHGGQTQNASAMLVSGSYFLLLGLQPAAGRLIGLDDDRATSAHPVAVLSHDYWRRQFQSNPGAIGETLVVNGQPLTILGVAPEGFRGTSLGIEPQIFVPITMRPTLLPSWEGFDDRRNYWVYSFARLKPGVDLDRAEASLNVLYSALIREVEVPLQEGLSDETLARFRDKRVVVREGARGQSTLHGEARAPLTLLLSVTGLVLLIACANIANLLLVRGAARAGEMAVRLSIGASRRHVVGQLLTESTLLAVGGGIAGLFTAAGTLRLLHSLLPARSAATIDATLDAPALVFTAAVSIVTGLAFGLFPALDASRPDLVSALRGVARQAGGSRAASRFRSTLATAQIATSMTLLVAAGLFTRSLLNITRVDLGLDTESLVTFAISPELNGYTPEQSLALYDRLTDELAALPGTAVVSEGMVRIIAGNNWGTSVSVEGFEAGPDTDVHTQFSMIGPNYFQALSVPLLAGRDFTRQDTLDTPRVAIVNQAFVRKFGLDANPVGQRLGMGRNAELEFEIVGLIPDTKYSEVKDTPPPQLFRAFRQSRYVGFMSYYIRAAGDVRPLLREIPGVVARVDPNLPVEDLRTMQMQVDENIFLDRFVSALSAAFAILATLLAAVGLYGVVAYTVGQRTQEFGLRMALGADASRVRRLVLGQVGRMTVVGTLLGAAAAVGLGRAAASLLFELEGSDPLVFTGAAVALTLVALAATYVPARRASTVDPMTALRYE